MGLLTRARSVEMGSGRPGGLEAHTRSRGGLLERSRQYRLAPEARTLFPAAVGQEELKGARSRAQRAGPAPAELKDLQLVLQRLPDGVEAPGQLFAALQQVLQLAHAALLLYDPARSVFAPWASHGLDQTTLHRLRIPAEAGGLLARLEAGEVLLLDDPAEREQWRRYFSTRQFATTEALLLVPFVHERRLIGLLLDSGARREGALATALRSWAPRAAELLYRAREQRVQALPPAPSPEGLRERVAAAAQAAAQRGRRLALVRVSLQGLMRALSDRNPFADPFRLQEDLFRIVSALLRPLGDVVQLEAGRVLLLTGAAEPPDLPLLTEHLRAGLRTLVPQLTESGPLELEETMRLCQATPEAAGTCLAELV